MFAKACPNFYKDCPTSCKTWHVFLRASCVSPGPHLLSYRPFLAATQRVSVSQSMIFYPFSLQDSAIQLVLNKTALMDYGRIVGAAGGSRGQGPRPSHRGPGHHQDSPYHSVFSTCASQHRRSCLHLFHTHHTKIKMLHLFKRKNNIQLSQ